MNEMAMGRTHAHHHRHCHVQRQEQREDGPDNAVQDDKSKSHSHQQQQTQTQTQTCSSRISIEDGEDVDNNIDGSQAVNNNCVHHVKNYKIEEDTPTNCTTDKQNSNNNLTTGISSVINATVAEEPKVQHLSLATGLIATYLIEIGIQIFLTFRCCPSLVSLFSTTVNPSPSATSGQSDYAWTWFLFISLSTILSSVLVTCLSIIWVCLGLDFAGRFCGRLLCYVMHFLHLGLLWRYLKLAFAYDSADIQEFIALRIFQLFIQSLPLTTIHLAWYITFQLQLQQEVWSGLTPWLILIESASVIIAIIISSHIKREHGHESLSCGCGESYVNHRHQLLHPKKKKSSNCNYDYDPEKATATIHKLTATTNKLMFLVHRMKTGIDLTVRAVLIYIRLILVALLVAQLRVWISALLIGSHFLLVFVWTTALRKKRYRDYDDEAIQDQDKLEYRNRVSHENRFFEADLVKKVIEFSYILFWDISFFRIRATASGISSNLRTDNEIMTATMTDVNLSLWAFPICLVLLENCIGLGYTWFHEEYLPQNMHLGLLSMALVLGLCILYFVVVNFLYGKCTISKLCDVTRRNNIITVPALTPVAANDHRHHHSENTSNTISVDQDQDQSSDDNKTVRDENQCSKTITVNETCNGDYGRNKIISQTNEKQKLEQQREHLQIQTSATLPSSKAVLQMQMQRKQRAADNDNDDDSCDLKYRNANSTLGLEKSRKKNCPKTGTSNYIDIRNQSQSKPVIIGASSTGGRRKLKKIRHSHTDDEYTSEKIGKNLTSKGVFSNSHYIRASHSSSNLVHYPSLVSPPIPIRNMDTSPTTTWVPDTCCNDSNGSSSNSRNTNTILTGSGEKSISLLEEQDDDENELEMEDKGFVFYFPKHYSPLIAPHDEQRISPTSAVTLSRTRKLHAHSTNYNYKHQQQQQHRPASAAPPPRCRSSSSNRYMRTSEGGKLTPVSNVSCVTMAMPFNSLQRGQRTSTPVEIKKASRVIMNTSSSPNKNNTSNNHVHRKAIYSTVPASPCAVDATRDHPSNSNKLSALGSAGEKRASDGGRCTSAKPSTTRHAASVTKKTRIDHHAKPFSRSRNSKGIIIDPPNEQQQQQQDSYDKLMEDSYGILIYEGEDTMSSAITSAGNCIDSVSACRNEKLQIYEPRASHQIQANAKYITPSPHQLNQDLLPSIFHVNKKLRVLCAKCLQNHDPLLTNCLLEENGHGHQQQTANNNHSGRRLHYNYNNNKLCLTNINNHNNSSGGGGGGLRRLHTPCAPSETTEYPSGTEMTWTLHDEEEYDDDDDPDDDQLSGGGGDDVSSSHLSTATYTTWPKSSYHPSQVQRQCQRQQQQKMSMWTTSTMLPPSMNNGTGRFPKEFTSREYVRTWLLQSGQVIGKGRQSQYHNHTCENSNGNCCKGHQQAHNLKRTQHVQIGPKSKTVPSKPVTMPVRLPSTTEDSYYETLATNQNQLVQQQQRERHKKRQPAPPTTVHEINEPDNNNANEVCFNQPNQDDDLNTDNESPFGTHRVQVEVIPEEFSVGVGGGKDLEIIV